MNKNSLADVKKAFEERFEIVLKECDYFGYDALKFCDKNNELILRIRNEDVSVNYDYKRREGFCFGTKNLDEVVDYVAKNAKGLRQKSTVQMRLF